MVDTVEMVRDSGRASGRVAPEQELYGRDGQVVGRSDLLFHGLGTPLHVDFCAVVPHADAYCRQASQQCLAAASRREREKAGKYADRVPPHTKFLGVSMETTGARGPGLIRLIKQISSRFRDSGQSYVPVNWAAPTMEVYLHQRLAVAMARGNDRRLRCAIDRHAVS